MSKSKGNVIVPTEILDRFGADAVRWRAARARPGADSPFDEAQMKVGRRLAIKVLNVAKFAIALAGGAAGPGGQDGSAPARVTVPLDTAVLSALAEVVAQATAAFEAFDYSRALEVTERFFWTFCDDYVELVKERAYGEGVTSEAADSARAALSIAMSVQLRLLAPFLPYATEEAWSWWRTGSIHTSVWPEVAECATATAGDPEVLTDVAAALAGLRGAKTMAKVSMRAEVARAVVTGAPEQLDRVRAGLDDLRAAGRLRELDLVPGEAIGVRDVELAAVTGSTA